MEQVKKVRNVIPEARPVEQQEENAAFAQALPLLYQILGIAMEEPQ
jgi:hypothetical protein